jgi:hypothetical protein
MIMDIATLSGHINMLVSEFLEAGGDPARCGDLLREIADEVFEEDNGRGSGGTI